MEAKLVAAQKVLKAAAREAMTLVEPDPIVQQAVVCLDEREDELLRAKLKWRLALEAPVLAAGRGAEG